MIEEKVTFFVQGVPLRGDLHLPRPGTPCVVLCHGLESSKDSHKWRTLAQELSGEGLAALRFNFRGCGEGPEASGGAFEDTTLTSRVEDLRAALDAAAARDVDARRLGVIGSSFGGMVGIAAGDPRVRALVLLATPAHLRQTEGLMSPHQEFLQLPSGQRLRRACLEDAARYDLPRLLAEHPRPTLIIHGEKDELVPVEHARLLYQAAREPKGLETIPGGSHTFDDLRHLAQVVGLAVAWMQAHL